jgi:hypothetical protein
MDDRPPCKGMTAAITFQPGTGRPDVPSRPCRNKARSGRDYCAAHEPDVDFNAAVKRQNEAAAVRSHRVGVQRDRESRLDWEHAVQRRLTQLSKMMLMPDPNPHRCTTVGVATFGYPDHGAYVGPEDYHLPELVQCESYIDHPPGDHTCAAELEDWRAKVEWRA